MNRLTANQLGELAKEAKRTQKLAEQMIKREQIKNFENVSLEQEHKIQLWRQLYIASINGRRSTKVKNFREQDRSYFEELGFVISPVFIRAKKREQYIKEIKWLKREIDAQQAETLDLELKIEEYWGTIDEIYTPPIRDWLNSNKPVAYACDFERWFGDEFNSVRLSGDDDLDKLKVEVEKRISQSKSSTRIRSLQDLLKAIADARIKLDISFDIDGAEERVLELNKNIKEYQDKIGQIEQDLGYVYEDNVISIHHLNWAHTLDSAEGAHFLGYTLMAVNWFSSEKGQETFKLFEYDVKNISEKGIRRVKLIRVDKSLLLHLINKDGNFSGAFPSCFDFIEAMALLGYKVAGLKNNQIQNQCIISW